MNPFSTEQKSTLRALSQLWQDTPFCLVGATALGCHLDRQWRRTEDLDICVSVSVDENPAGLVSLPGWSNPNEHEWVAPTGVRVDIIPAGPEVLRSGAIRWPKSGREMNLTGFRLVFEQSVRFEVEPDVVISVASLAVIALLKIVAYLDRPWERERDLEDLAHILEGYAPADDPRRWDSDLLDRAINFDRASAFLLGRDLAAMVDQGERLCIERFLAAVDDDRDPAQSAARMLRVGPRRWRQDPNAQTEVIRIFGAGFQLLRG